MTAPMNGLISHTFAFVMILAVVNFSSPREFVAAFFGQDQTPEKVREIENLPTIIDYQPPLNVVLAPEEFVPVVTACFDPMTVSNGRSNGCQAALDSLAVDTGVPATIERIASDQEALRVASGFYCRALWAEARKDRRVFDYESCLSPAH